jgi:hypothetical protein
MYFVFWNVSRAYGLRNLKRQKAYKCVCVGWKFWDTISIHKRNFSLTSSFMAFRPLNQATGVCWSNPTVAEHRGIRFSSVLSVFDILRGCSTSRAFFLGKMTHLEDLKYRWRFHVTWNASMMGVAFQNVKCCKKSVTEMYQMYTKGLNKNIFS